MEEIKSKIDNICTISFKYWFNENILQINLY